MTSRRVKRRTFGLRARPLTNNEVQFFHEAHRRQLKIVLLVPLMVVGGLVLGRVSLQVAVPIAAAIGLGWTAYCYAREKDIQKTVLLMPLILIASRGAALYLESRLFATTMLAATTILLILMYGARPLRLYQEWLLADARLRAETRSAIQTLPLRPSILILATLMALVIVIPWRHSTTLAIVSVFAASLTLILFFAAASGKPLPRALATLFTHARRMHHLYLAYPDRQYGAPGQWLADESLNKRRRHHLLLTIPPYLTVIVALSFCCPWELFASWFVPGFEWHIPPTSGERAYDWMLYPFMALGASRAPGYLWVFIIALPTLLVLPSLMLLAVYTPPLVRLDGLQEQVKELDRDTRTEWEQYVDRLRSSADPEEARHLFLGFFPESGAPALLDPAILGEHAYITGQSGSGKTMLALTPMLTQLIRGQPRNPSAGEDDEQSRFPPIVILDYKGDFALFNTVKQECARRDQALGRPSSFRYFNIEGRCATHYFDPFQNIQSEPRTVIEFCELIVQALNLYHGDQYGASYYSRQHRDLLLTILDEAERANRSPKSWRELYELVKPHVARRGPHKFDAFELLSVVHAMTFYPQLVTDKAPDDAEVIHMPTVIRENQVVYFCFPARIANMSVKEIGRLALYSLLTAAADYRQAGNPRKQIYLFIDEFQQIASENLSIILEQARGFGIGVVLTNQNPHALKKFPGDLYGTVMTNTRFKQFFSITNPDEIREIMFLSGEKSDYLTTETHTEHYSTAIGRGAEFRSFTTTARGWSHGMSYREIRVPRLSVDDISQISHAHNDSIVFVSRGKGFTQLGGIPARVRTPWTMTEAEYQRRDSTPWPSRQEDAPRAIIPRVTPAEAERKQREFLERDQELRQLIASIKSEDEDQD